MKIEFKSKKWEKEIKSLKEAKKILKCNYYNNIKYVYERFLQSTPPDYLYLYGCFVGDFEIVARTYFVDDNEHKVIDNTFLSVHAFFCFKEKLPEREFSKYVAIENTLSDYEYTVCKAIAINQLDYFANKCEDSIMANLFYGNEEIARQLIDRIPDDGDKQEAIYYISPIFLKQIYQAIIEKDAESFNKYMIQRIKKYRKNMVGYSTIIDYTSIALFKVAQKYGINKEIDVVEVPTYFWDDIQISEKIKDVLPVKI